MKRLFLVVMMMLLVAPMVYGQAVIASGQWSVMYKGPAPCANDMHVEGQLESSNNLMPTLQTWTVSDNMGNIWWVNGFSIVQDINNPLFWNYTIDFKTKGCLKPGGVITFALQFLMNHCNVNKFFKFYFTYDGVPLGKLSTVKGESSELMGSLVSFRIPPIKDSGFETILELSNNIENSVVMLDTIEIASTDKMVDLDKLNEENLGLPGTPGSEEFRDIKWVPLCDRLQLNPGEKVELSFRDLIETGNGRFILIRSNSMLENNGEGEWAIGGKLSKGNAITIKPVYIEHQE